MSLKTLIALAVVLSMISASPSYAQFDLNWVTVDSGGGTSSGGTFSVSGTIGQPDVGSPLVGGTFQITGGFWAPPGIPCPADITGNGTVDVQDLLLLINNWGNGPGNPADLNGDGTVNVGDLLLLINNWGTC